MRIRCLLAFLCLGLSQPAQAGYFDITFSNASGFSAGGELETTPNGDGTFTAVSGYFNVNSSGSGIPAGHFLLLPNPNGTAVTTPASYPTASYDDQLLPFASGLLNINGLDFTISTGGKEYLLNLFNNTRIQQVPPFELDYYLPDGNSYTTLGNVEITPAPEPAQMAAGLAVGAVGSLSLLVRHWRRRNELAASEAV